MGKIIVFAVSGDEEQILFRMQKYLQSKENCMLISESENKKLSFPDLEIDLYLREIRQQKRVIKLTDLEFRILLYLAEQPGRVFTYRQIYEAIWGEEYIYEKGNIMSHIRHIREKIEPDSKNPRYIENIRGVGYCFKKQ